MDALTGGVPGGKEVLKKCTDTMNLSTFCHLWCKITKIFAHMQKKVYFCGMILNYIWISLILLAILMGLVQAICYGNVDIFSTILNSTFDSAKTGFELSLGLTGVLSLWMGIMKIGEQAGAVNSLGKAINPFFSRIFPDIPKGHPVFGTMLMNIAANMLGLDNAATPMGLKAMGELQELNTDKTKASNAMIMFVVLGASGLTLIPTTIMAYRAQLGAANPADVFLPILIATYVATLVGLICVCIAQKIKMKDPVVIGTLVGLTALVGLLVWAATLLSGSHPTLSARALCRFRSYRSDPAVRCHMLVCHSSHVQED